MIYLNNSKNPEKALRQDNEGNHVAGVMGSAVQYEAQPVWDETDSCAPHSGNKLNKL